MRATVEQLRAYVDAYAPRGVHSAEVLQRLVAQAPLKQWEVQAILDERGSTASSTKEYLIDWGKEWRPSRESEALLRAPKKVREFHARKHRATERRTGKAPMRMLATVGEHNPGELSVTRAYILCCAELKMFKHPFAVNDR